MISFWLQIIETSGAKIYGLLTSVLALFITARVLGPGGRGEIAAVITWVGLFATFAGLSLGQVMQYRIQMKKSQHWLTGTFSTLFYLCGILSALAYFVAYLLFKVTHGQLLRDIPVDVLSIGFLMLPFIIWEEFGSHLLTAVGMLRAYNISQISGKTIGICALILLAFWSKLDVTSAIFSMVGGQVILCIIVLLALGKVTTLTIHVDIDEIKELLKGASKLHLNTIGAFLVVQSNILMLNQFATKAEVGWYQLAFQLITIMLVIPQAASMVLYSKMAEVGPDNLWPEQKQLSFQVLIAMIFMSCLAYFVAPFMITHLAGPSFERSIKIFRLLLPALLGITISILLSNQWIGRGIFLPTTIITVASAIISIAINFITIPKYGMIGAVWSMLITFAFLAVITQVFFAFYCEKKYRETFGTLS